MYHDDFIDDDDDDGDDDDYIYGSYPGRPAAYLIFVLFSTLADFKA